MSWVVIHQNKHCTKETITSHHKLIAVSLFICQLSSTDSNVHALFGVSLMKYETTKGDFDLKYLQCKQISQIISETNTGTMQ